MVARTVTRRARRSVGVVVTAALLALLAACVPIGGPTNIRVAIGDASILEGDGGSRTVAFTVALSEPSKNATSVVYATTDGTATANDGDYQSKGGTLTIPAGVVSIAIPVIVRGDTKVEGSENFGVTISSPIGLTISDGVAIGSIVDDDPSSVTEVSVGDGSVLEGNAGARTVQLAVTLSKPAPAPVTVVYDTEDGSARGNRDFTVIPPTALTFATGQLSKLVSITILSDTLAEEDETLDLVLASATGATIRDGLGVATIVDDDALADPDGDGYIGDDCAPNDAVIHPGAPDTPDLAFVDSNCDGIDGDAAQAVFVAPTGSDANAGTRPEPKQTIQAAVSAALASGKDVYAAAGHYDENDGVELATGVDIYGGYAGASWLRAAANQSEIHGSPQAVSATDTGSVKLQLLHLHTTVVPSAAGSHRTVYGVRAVRSTLALERVAVDVDTAASGEAGTNGAAAGSAGQNGGAGASGSCDGSTPGTGGPGGPSSVGRVGGTGGSGGSEGANTGATGGTGVVGTLGGPGGAGGDPGHVGTNGNNGSTGVAGNDGNGASGGGALETWSGNSGSVGTGGQPGNGGGGGGGGGGQGCTFCNDGSGNGGGGGGGGGAPGGGGDGGGPGGGAFGVYMFDSAVTLSSGSTITVGDGGDGGAGGAGAPGSAGGSGGPGATACTGEIGAGGAGGRGGDGGHGGNGGGGAGGLSIGIAVIGTSTSVPTDTTITFGTPGDGGSGAGTGNNGAPGIAAATWSP